MEDKKNSTYIDEDGKEATNANADPGKTESPDNESEGIPMGDTSPTSHKGDYHYSITDIDRGEKSHADI